MTVPVLRQTLTKTTTDDMTIIIKLNTANIKMANSCVIVHMMYPHIESNTDVMLCVMC